MRRVLEGGNPPVGIFAARVWERRAFADEFLIPRRPFPLRPRAARGPREFLQRPQLMRVSTRERGQQRRLPVSNMGGPQILVAERDRSVALPPYLSLFVFNSIALTNQNINITYSGPFPSCRSLSWVSHLSTDEISMTGFDMMEMGLSM